jgi:hypothetical protein
MKKKISAKKKKSHPKFEYFMKWYGFSLDTIFYDMTGGNTNLSSLEDWTQVRKEIRSRRVCIDNGRVFAPTLDEIAEHKYRLIEDVPISEWNLDIDDPDIPKSQSKGMRDLVKLLSLYNARLFLPNAVNSKFRSAYDFRERKSRQ